MLHSAIHPSRQLEGLAEQADDRFVPASFPTQERTGSYRAGPAPISAMSGVQGWKAECRLSL